jgi:hypothetical protein
MADDLSKWLAEQTKVAEPESDLKNTEVDRMYGLKFAEDGEYSSGTHADKSWPDAAKGGVKTLPVEGQEKKEQAITLPDANKVPMGAKKPGTPAEQPKAS